MSYTVTKKTVVRSSSSSNATTNDAAQQPQAQPAQQAAPAQQPVPQQGSTYGTAVGSKYTILGKDGKEHSVEITGTDKSGNLYAKYDGTTTYLNQPKTQKAAFDRKWSKTSTPVTAAQPGAVTDAQPVTIEGVTYTPVGTTVQSVTPQKNYEFATSVPKQYTEDPYAKVYPAIERAMRPLEPLSDEQLEKLRKRQRSQAIVNGIADAAQAMSNLIFTTKYAPNAYDPKHTLSARYKEMWDKEKAARDANNDKYLNYAMMLGRLKGENQARGLEAWKVGEGLKQDAYNRDAGRLDKANEGKIRWQDFVANRKDTEKRNEQWTKEYEQRGQFHKDEMADRAADRAEKRRQFNQSMALEWHKIRYDEKKDSVEFTLGKDKGTVSIPSSRLNSQTISQLFASLPFNVRKDVHGKAITNSYGGVVGYEQPDDDAMLKAIGQNIDGSVRTQKLVKQLAQGVNSGNRTSYEDGGAKRKTKSGGGGNNAPWIK